MDPSRLDYTYDFKVHKEPYYSRYWVSTDYWALLNEYYLLLGRYGKYTYFLVYFNPS